MLTPHGMDGGKKPEVSPLAVTSQSPFPMGMGGWAVRIRCRCLTFSDCIHLLLPSLALEKHAACPHPSPGPWL